MDPSVDLSALLERAATGAKRASERALMREAAAIEHARATTARDVAHRAAEAGYRDGFRDGVDAALDPCEPEHAATVAAWRERRAAAVSGGRDR